MTASTPRVIANIVLTLDGRTCGPGGPADMSCIAPYGGSEEGHEAVARMTDASVVLLGRLNYEGFQGYWPPVAHDETADPRDRAFAAWLDQVPKIVFSTTLARADWSGATLAQEGPVETVRRLRSEKSGDIRVLSSQSLIRELLRADELDRLEIILAPEVVGGGPRLLDDSLPPSRWRPTTPVVSELGSVHLTYDRVR